MHTASAKSSRAGALEASADPGKTNNVATLRRPSRWHDPLQVIQDEAPSQVRRIVLWATCVLICLLLLWAAISELDIVASAEGKLVPETLVKVVQPADSGVIKQILVHQGQVVKAGQVLIRLDPTLASADKIGLGNDLAIQMLQARRLEAELAEMPMVAKAADDPQQYAQVLGQYITNRRAFLDSLDQEKALIFKAEHELRSARAVEAKLQQTLPIYERTAEAFAKLEKDGFVGNLAAAEKLRDAAEKTKDLDAQRASVAALQAMLSAQNKKVDQLQSNYKSEIQRELANTRLRIVQLQPNLEKTLYRAGQLELKAPQDGVIKDLATTTIGSIVQPGAVLLTLVPGNERLYADVMINNDDIGFTEVGQTVQIKVAAYPFQKYGMLTGKIVHIGADADGSTRQSGAVPARRNNPNDLEEAVATGSEKYKARVILDKAELRGLQGERLQVKAGMQIMAEIHHGKRTVLEYLFSPVKKVLKEAGHEK